MSVAELNNHFNRYFAMITIRDKRHKKNFELCAQNGKFTQKDELNEFLSSFLDRDVTDWEYCYDDNHLYVVID